MKHIFYSLILSLGLILSSNVRSEYAFDITGTVDRIDFKSGEIVIDDMLFKLGQTTTVYDIRNSLISQKKVKKGTRVGFKAGNNTGSVSNNQAIYELWVLPSNFKLPSTGEHLSRPRLR